MLTCYMLIAHVYGRVPTPAGICVVDHCTLRMRLTGNQIKAHRYSKEMQQMLDEIRV